MVCFITKVNTDKLEMKPVSVVACLLVNYTVLLLIFLKTIIQANQFCSDIERVVAPVYPASRTY